MGLLAGELLKLVLPCPDKRLFTFVETDGCGADGIFLTTGCSIGCRTMRVLDFGKMAATFVDTVTLEAIRLVPHSESRTQARQYAPEAVDRWQAQLHAYQIMPAEELFTAQRVTLTVSLEKIISQHGLRVHCSICGEEIMNSREEMVDGKPVCRACAGQIYYVTQPIAYSCRFPHPIPDLVLA